MNEERRRILDMLAADRISVEQAEALLRALGGGRQAPAAPEPPEPPPAKGARSLRIEIHNDDSGKGVNVTVPIGLIKFASRFLPSSARDQLADSGIDLEALVGSLDSPELLSAGSTLVEVHADGDDGLSTILIKAV